MSNVHGFELREHQELWCARRGGPVSGGPGELYTVWLCAQVGQVSKAQNSHGNFYNKNGPRDYHFKHFLDLENKLKPFFGKNINKNTCLYSIPIIELMSTKLYIYDQNIFVLM